MKKIINKLISAVLLSSMLLPYSVSAKVASESINVSYNDIKLYLNEQKITLTDADGNVIEPFTNSGTTYLPLRAVAEALSMNVGWDGATSTVTLTTDGNAPEIKELEYTPFIGQAEINIAYKDISVVLNSEKLNLKSADGKDIEPFIYNNTTYLPLRAVAEATNVTVEWDGETKSIYMTSEEDAPKTESTYDTSLQSDWTSEEASAYGYTFAPTEDGEYMRISLYNGTETDVLVPAKIDGKPVYISGQVGEGEKTVFESNKTIKYVSFENGVKIERATKLFAYCTELEGVYNMKADSYLAATFIYCSKLKYADYEISKITSGYHSFGYCPNLTVFPDTIDASTYSLEKMFINCKYLSGDIYCYAPNIGNANEAFNGTVHDITFHVPYPSKTYNTVIAAGLPENVTLKKMENKIAYLPKEINVASYTTINLYNYAVAPEYKDCTFTWKCDVGSFDESKFTISGTEENVGSYPISVTVSKDGEEYYTAESTLNIVSAKKMSKSMSLVAIGDQFVIYKEWITRVNRNSQRIKFVGTRQSSLHEGRSAATPEYYTKAFNYTSDKSGIGTDNPFFNQETGKFDWAYYNNYSGFTPAAVQFTFHSGTAINSQTSVSSLRVMVDAIHEVAPKTQIFITIPSYLSSFNASADINLFKYALALDEEFGDEENVHLIPVNLVFNRDKDTGKSNLPNTDGYNAWGDIMFGYYAAVLQ